MKAFAERTEGRMESEFCLALWMLKWMDGLDGWLYIIQNSWMDGEVTFIQGISRHEASLS